jgi:hypothetical protein
VTQTAEHVIVRFRWDDDEGDDWIEGDGLLDPVLAARGELATGDLRLLYLGWLLMVQLGELDEDDEDLADEAEPPVPAGLRELSDSLASVAQFLNIDDDLIAVAAKASAPLVSVSDDGIADWVTALAASEKDKFLTMVAEGEGAQVEALLVCRFRRESQPAGTTPASTGRLRANCWRPQRPGGPRESRPRPGRRRKHGHGGQQSRPPPTSATCKT